MDALLVAVFGYGTAILQRSAGEALRATVGSIEIFVVGVLILVFVFVGSNRGRDSSLASGVVLIVLAVVTWFWTGPADLLGVLGALLALLSGVLFVIPDR
ncbi:MAG TPA: hypothetical protein VGS23_04975 [Thermoplasmata archaeon]|nr:hypothetical protein [Thermoplasmata archaeon]